MNKKQLPSRLIIVFRKIGKYFGFFLISLMVLLLVIFLLLQTALVQNFAKDKMVAYLSAKLNTRVSINRLGITFPKLVVLEGVYLEDQQKDTLLFGKRLMVDIDMFKLLKSEIKINEISLDGFYANVKRQKGDTAFNFQFIPDAFLSDQDKAVKDTGLIKFAISKIVLDRIRLDFRDLESENYANVSVHHFDAEIKSVDLSNLVFNVPRIVLDGLTGIVHQSKPISYPSVVSTVGLIPDNEAPINLGIVNKEVLISNTDIKYTDDASKLSTAFKIKRIRIHPEKLDLANSVIELKDIELRKLDGYLILDVVKNNPLIINTTNSQIKTAAISNFPWKITVASLLIDDADFSFDDNNVLKIKYGIDYSHLAMQDFVLHANHFLFHKDSIALNIANAKMTESNGFVLSDLQAEILHTDKQTSLEKLYLKTPSSLIKRSAILRYPSLAAIQKKIELLEMEINIDESYLSVKDMLTFMPALSKNPAFRNRFDKFFINANVHGSLRKLLIETFQFRGFQQTDVDLNGIVLNALDAKKVSGNFLIKKFKTSRMDLVSLLPVATIPNTITIPDLIQASGKISGGMNDGFADLSISTSLGSASLKGRISNALNKDGAVYTADVSTRNLNMGAIMKNPQKLGMVTARFKVSGRGYNPNTASVDIDGTIFSAEVMKYNYKDLNLEASLANKKFISAARINDTNIAMNVLAKGTIGDLLSDVSLAADIDSINTSALHWTAEPIYLHGKVTANFPMLSIDSINGDVQLTKIVVVANGQRIALDTVSVLASFINQQQKIAIQSGFMNGEISGEYKIAELGDIVQHAVLPYIPFENKLHPKIVNPYDVALQLSVVDHPILHSFLPGIKRFDGLLFSSSLSNIEGIKANMVLPYLNYNENVLDSFTVSANSSSSGLDIITNIESFKSGSNLELFGTTLKANLTNTKLDFGLFTKDRAAKPKYAINGLVSRNSEKSYSITISPDSLMLNYDPWFISKNNQISLVDNQIQISDFDLENGDQHVVLNTTAEKANYPLFISFKNFRLATLSAFVQPDSLLVNGSLNGNVEINDLMKQPNFVTDLVMKNLSIKKDTIGDVNIKVSNTVKNVFATNISISGRGNEANLTGNYYLKPNNSSLMDMNVEIKSLPLKTLEAFSMSMIDSASGSLNGNVAIKGTIEKPEINGNINFKKTQFFIPMLGSIFAINNERITVDNQGIKFDTFKVKDSSNNLLIVDGFARTTNFTDFNFDLTIKANDFRAINTVKMKNSLYYGQLYFTTNMTLKGTSLAPIVDGKLIVNKRTNFTVVLPQTEMGIVDRKGIIEFVDMDLDGTDSIFSSLLKRYDSTLNNSAITGLDVSVNIQVVKEANFNLVIDEANGDLVNLQGEAFLNGGIDPSGKITLTGTYELETGGYELSFNFLRRKFDIVKGSKITWTGEPTTAEMDVTAVYIANTSAIDLVQNQINDDTKIYYQQKLPFQVLLKMKGELLKPILTFDIALPIENTARVSNDILLNVNARLDQIKQEPSELNKQVFALLLLNRFVSENPFQSSSSSGFNATSFAKQSVSKILTEQLNRLAGDLIAGVDISFDVNSADDYSTGERRDRTDFNVQVSKQLLNDRLKISVGSNYEIEGPKQSNGQSGSNVVGNITIDYKLTQDGRYLVRGYRKNDFDAIIEGMVVETGLKFIIAVDYNKFKEIFRNKRKRKPSKNKKLIPATEIQVVNEKM